MPLARMPLLHHAAAAELDGSQPEGASAEEELHPRRGLPTRTNVRCSTGHPEQARRGRGVRDCSGADRFGLGRLPIDGISRARPADDVRIENPDLKVQGYYFRTMAAVDIASTDWGLAPIG
jgi:hypothetical protein